VGGDQRPDTGAGRRSAGSAPFGSQRPFAGRGAGPGRDRPSFDRPWRDPAQRPVDAYRPGVAPSDLLGPNEELVAGRRPVEEAFVAKRPAKRLLVVPQRRQALERLVLHATSLRIPVVEVEGGSLTAVAGFDGHQGIALVVEPRVFAGLDDVLARAVERGEPPFILVLDSLEDPQNVGTLLRSAEAAGVHGVLFPTHRQAPLSPAAIKASAGAVEHLLLCPVDDLAAALSDLRIRGLRVAAAEADAPLTTAQADLRGPLAIVVGSEGQGVSPLIRRRADVAVRIPMRGAIGSLNAAVAGSILLFAAVAQRDPAGEGSAIRPRPATFDELVDATAAGVEPRNTDAATGSAEPPARKRRKGLSTEVPAASSTGGTDGTDGRTEPDAELPTESLAGNHEEPPTETPPMKAARAGRARTTTGPAAGAKAQPAAAKPRKSALDDAAAQATEPATQDTATVAKRKPAATRAKVATAPKPSAAEVKPKAKRAPRAAATSKGRPPAAEDATTSAEDSGADDLLPGGPPPE
jgi:23S rRNA (guanosine2251-2'-O)-methyltransferase